jgi:hypothetical protein
VTIRSTVILDVPVFGQQEAECGSTSLKAVVWFHGRRLSAKRLRQLCRVTEEGVDHEALVLGAVATGATVYAKAKGTAAELRWFLVHGYPVIVGWWSMDPGDAHFDPKWSPQQRLDRDCGHFSVVYGMTKRHVLLMDPQWAPTAGRLRIVGRRRLPMDAFMGVWYDTDTKAYKKVERWYMVVNYEGRRFAGQFPGGRDYSSPR